MLKRAVNYILFMLIGNAVYGLMLYNVVTFLARESLLLAYAANIALIILVLCYDEYLLRKGLRAENILALLKKSKSEKERALSVWIYRWELTYFVSFKTFLFIFYIIMLIFSQIIRFKPEWANEDITTFFSATDYSVLILLAFKDFGEEFAKDRERSKERLEEFNKRFENYEENNEETDA